MIRGNKSLFFGYITRSGTCIEIRIGWGLNFVHLLNQKTRQNHIRMHIRNSRGDRQTNQNNKNAFIHLFPIYTKFVWLHFLLLHMYTYECPYVRALFVYKISSTHTAMPHTHCVNFVYYLHIIALRESMQTNLHIKLKNMLLKCNITY